MAKEFIARNGLVSKGTTTVSGSLITTQPATFSGSLDVTGSVSISISTSGNVTGSLLSLSNTNNGSGNTRARLQFFGGPAGTTTGGYIDSYPGNAYSEGILVLGSRSTDVMYLKGGERASLFTTPSTAHLFHVKPSNYSGTGGVMRVESSIGGGLSGTYVQMINGESGYFSGLKVDQGNSSSNRAILAYGQTVLQGKGTTSSTTALKVENANASSSLVILDDGDVGIGTNSPTYKMHISSSNNGDGLAIHYPSTNNSVFPFYLGTSIQSTYFRANTNILELKNNGAASTIKTVGSVNNLVVQSATDLVFNTSGTSERMRITNTGNVGIGTNSPSYKLHINGDAQIGVDSSGTNNFLYIQADTSKARYIHFKDNATRQGIGFPSGSQNLEIKSLNGGADSGIVVDYNTGRINVGHTDTNDAVLHIQGEGTTSSTTALLVENANASASLIVRDDGNVGIGTTNPTNALDVSGSLRVKGSINRPFTVLNGFTYHQGEVGGWRLEYGFKGSSGTARGGFGAQGANDDVQYYYIGSTQLNPTIAIEPEGNVGIGTTTPSYKLDVSGSGNFTDGLTVTGSLIGQPVDITPTTATASLDCSLGNFFDLTLSASYELYLSASNIQAGQTMNLRITQPATSGSLTYGSEFKFPGGIPYEVSATGSAVDIVSFISFDSSTLYGTAIKNLS